MTMEHVGHGGDGRGSINGVGWWARVDLEPGRGVEYLDRQQDYRHCTQLSTYLLLDITAPATEKPLLVQRKRS